MTKRLIYLIVIALLALTGCSVAKRPVIEMLYAQRREMAAEVEYKRYLRGEENK